MAKKENTKPIEAVEVEEDEGDGEGLLFGIVDGIYDLAHDLFPDAVENFHAKVGNALERAANYMEEIGPSWESACDRVYNKVMNFLDGAEEKTMKTIDKLQHSPVGAAIDKIYEKNHRERG